MRKNIIRTAVLSAAVVPIALLGAGVASADPTLDSAVGGPTGNVTVRVGSVSNPQVCYLIVDGVWLDHSTVAPAMNNVEIKGGPFADGRHEVNAWCDGGAPNGGYAGPKTVFTGPLAPLYQTLYNSGSAFLTP